MTRKRRVPPKPPTSIRTTLKGMVITSAARKLMGNQPQALPLSYGPPVLIRNNVLRFNYKNPIRTHNLKRLNRFRNIHNKNTLKGNYTWWRNNKP